MPTGVVHRLTLVFALSLTSAAYASEVTEEAAKQQVCQFVRSRLGFEAGHYLRATRREDLEDQLLAAQVKVRGQIHKAALFYEVTETGYEILSPEEALYHSSVDGAGRWYVAFDTRSGELYGIGGFGEAVRDFNRLVTAAKVIINSAEAAQSWADFYLTAAVGTSQGTFLIRESDLQRKVEDIAEDYSSSRKQAFSAKRWMQDLEKSGVSPVFGVQVHPEGGKFQVQVETIAISGDRSPILQRLQFAVSSGGTVEGQTITALFPLSKHR